MKLLKNIAIALFVFMISTQASPRHISKNSDRISIDELARKYGLKIIWIEREKKAVLKNEKINLTFEVHKRDFSINNTIVYLGGPVYHSPGTLFIDKKDFEKTIYPILFPQNLRNSPKLKKIVIDPGHGGKDIGAHNKQRGIFEKDLTLDIAFRLKKLLEMQGFRVLLTRTNDHYIDCESRSQWANQQKADLFISIHINSISSHISSEIQGMETYVLTPTFQPSTGCKLVNHCDKIFQRGNRYDDWNAIVGYNVQTSLRKLTHCQDRGLKRMRLRVLKELECPGLLVECGFLSHPLESRLLQTSNHKQKIAEAIAQGVLNYNKHLLN